MQRSLDCWDLQNGRRYTYTHPYTLTHLHMLTHTLTTLHPSQQDNAKLLQERAVAYINADSAIEGECVCVYSSKFSINYTQCFGWISFSSCLWITGMYTLRVDCTPSLHTLVYDLTKQVSRFIHAKWKLHLKLIWVNSFCLSCSLLFSSPAFLPALSPFLSICVDM